MPNRKTGVFDLASFSNGFDVFVKGNELRPFWQAGQNQTRMAAATKSSINVDIFCGGFACIA